MSRIVVIIVWLLCSSVLYNVEMKSVFGVRVSIGVNSSINTYVCFQHNGRSLINKRLFDEQSFIKIVSGYWPSIYNPKRINYFDKNNIGCGVAIDSITMKEYSYCEPFEELWKIRFATYPFQHNAEMGWSNKYHKPAPSQEKYLYDRYGVESVDANFFLDTSFWLLLQDVQDSTWIMSYKALR